ncbi:chromosome-associated kinesin KIF4 [Drosophila tropicalis]|uniref:chromosome-associated kinesin KIF4 n=1 Tax=Drosophila tropicalis TaxID=46794 RepID=UPI0035ABC494
MSTTSLNTNINSDGEADTVSVALRVRPLVRSEIERGCQIAVQRAGDGSPQVTVNRAETFTYNYVFDTADSQQDIYDDCVHPKLKKLLSGYNVTILAYGQTGSGKTYTMGTSFNGIMDENAGVIPRAIYEIFKEIDAMSSSDTTSKSKFVVTCSFVELYQEQLIDLFSPNRSTVDVREVKSRIVMPGLTELQVQSAKEVTDYLMKGSAGRAVGSTAMNESSSRSHAIFTITVVASQTDGRDSVTTSKFNLVDLAGSERASKTLASGDRFKEGVNINKGLLALGNVINSLGSGQASGFIAYRQSKLTRLLQDSLGGNSITLMIACVSPADYNVPETLSTLRYADRALQIKNRPVVNLDPHAAEVNQLKDIIQKLRMDLLSQGAVGGMSNSLTAALGSAGLESVQTVNPMGSGMSAAERQRLLEKLQLMEQKNLKLQKDLHQALIDVAENEMRAHIAEQNHDRIKTHLLEMKTKLKLQYEQKQQTEVVGDTSEFWVVFNEAVNLAHQELERSETEMKELTHTSIRSNASNNDIDNAGELQELNQMEEYTAKQLNLNGELKNINRQLNLKQELHERVLSNFSRLQMEVGQSTLAEEAAANKIDELESERRQLLEKLRSMKSKDSNVSKLAEERRKRLQQLEQELGGMRRRLQTLNNVVKMHEKEKAKITNLSQEIRDMKEAKVKLIRAMRQESEKFRQWKMIREKEVTQLKSKDRKLKSEMARQEQLHVKQRNVLKRKCEEALAANKRLKDALERKASAQAQRQRQQQSGNTTTKSKDNIAAIEQELEIILSVLDAEIILETLMEDRAVFAQEYQELKQNAGNEANQALLSAMEEDMEMRNAQIADFQQKVQLNNIDTHVSILADNPQSLAESRTVSKHVLKTMIQQRRDHAQAMAEQRIRLTNNINQLTVSETKLLELAEQLQRIEQQHREEMHCQQREYEEKVAVLLRSAQANNGDIQQQFEKGGQTFIIEDLLASKEAIQLELDALKSKADKPKKSATREALATEYPEILEESIMEMDDSYDLDPDWKPNTARRHKKLDATNKSKAEETTISEADNSSNSNCSGLVSCKCRIRCDSKRCLCYANGSSCLPSCRCKGSCHNPSNTFIKDEAQDDNDKENLVEMPPPTTDRPLQSNPNLAKRTSSIETIKSEPGSTTTLPSTPTTSDENIPKLARMSGLTFNTPRRKFFN